MKTAEKNGTLTSKRKDDNDEPTYIAQRHQDDCQPNSRRMPSAVRAWGIRGQLVRDFRRRSRRRQSGRAIGHLVRCAERSGRVNRDAAGLLKSPDGRLVHLAGGP